MNSDVIDFASLAPAYPEMLLAAGALVLLVMGVVINKERSILVSYTAVLLLLITAALILFAPADGVLFNGVFIGDSFVAGVGDEKALGWTGRVMARTEVPGALIAGVKAAGGRPLINSVTGEAERMATVFPLVAEHGCAVIAISNDESGISMDPRVRFAVARRIVEEAARYGIPREDILIDPLVMPAGAVHAAGRAVLDLLRWIGDELGCNSVCGASNVSFGLPDREAINAAFLPMLIAGGMTSAITNPLRPELRKAVMAADLLMGNDPDCLRWLRYQRQLARSAPQAGAAAPAGPAPDAGAAPDDREARRAARRAERAASAG